MDISTLRWFFFWCVILNALILGGSALAIVFAGDRIYHVLRKWFALDREIFYAVVYFFFGLYKILLLVFGFVPWLALLIAG